MGIVGVDLWLHMGVVEPQRMAVQLVFFACRFCAGNVRRVFAGEMPLVHLEWGRLWRGIGAFCRCYLQHLQSSCDFFVWTRRLGLIHWLGGIGQRHGVAMIVLLH